MDCNHARLIFQTAHPLATELDPRESAELSAHLADCPDCGSWAASERRIDQHLGKAMRDVPIPAGLHLQILRRMGSEQRGRRATWVRRLAVAAALLFAVLGYAGYRVWWGPKPQPDIAEILADCSVGQGPFNQKTVEQWFTQQGLSIYAPPDLNYALLQSLSVEQLQGSRIACMLFRFQKGANRPVLAKVFVLTDKQFDLKTPAQNMVPSFEHRRVEVWDETRVAGVRYVMICSEEDGAGHFFERTRD
jgi:hypothetical protein